MSKEDKQFFDGLLLGGILVGIVLVVFIIYAFFRNPQPLGEYAMEQFEQTNSEKQNVDKKEPDLAMKRPASEEQSVIIPQETVLITVNDSPHIIVSELKHPSKDLIYRLLTDETQAHREVFEANRSESTYNPNCDDAGLLPVKVSIWDSEGERLLHINETPSEGLKRKVYCPTIVRWYSDDLILLAVHGDAGLIYQDIYSYSQNGEVSYLYSEIQRLGYKTWMTEDHAISQSIRTDEISNLIIPRAPYDLYEIPNIEEGTIVYEANVEVKVDLLSDYNLTNYSKGLEYIIGGERVVLPWIVK